MTDEPTPFRQNVTGILGQVRNPLIFFSLALLVIEGIFAAVAIYSQMTGGYQFITFCIMAILFLVVVGTVAWITAGIQRGCTSR